MGAPPDWLGGFTPEGQERRRHDELLMREEMPEARLHTDAVNTYNEEIQYTVRLREGRTRRA